jgi:hypothetical protein
MSQPPRILDSNGVPYANNTSLKKESETSSFGDKIYQVPESFHALRREMQVNYPETWRTIGGALFWAPETFFGYICEALDIFIQFDTRNVDGMCKKALDAFREKRGLTALHQPHEYYLPDSQQEKDKVVVENGVILGTVGELNAKREL